MRRINQSEDRDQVAYHIGRNDTPVFEESHQFRVKIAREYLGHGIERVRRLTGDTINPIRIVDLGCGSGDISGPFASTSGNDVIGIDCVPAASSAKDRFEMMSVIISPVEEVQPFECDVLVMCEFLEHLDEPVRILEAWMPKARAVVIGHPIDDVDGLEPGHSWSYTMDDFWGWFSNYGFEVVSHATFGMGPFPQMACGLGIRPWAKFP